ncbi:MAG: hypothetical protein ISS56_05005 [Anaerolineae bacterium]|nr:hypothetical protein [Anaerolineae bacterium]
MVYQIERHLPFNIALLYDAFSLDDVDRTAIREILGREGITPLETPDVMLMVSTGSNIVVQAGNRRILVIDQSENPTIEGSPIPSVAARVHTTVPGSLVAFGFNYDLGISQAQPPANELLINRFLPNREEMEALLDGDVQSVAPTIRFTRGDVRYMLGIRGADDTHLHVHFNAEFAQTPLPGAEELARSFASEFDVLRQTLDRVLGE